MTGCGDNFNFQRTDAESITLIEVVVIKNRGSFLRNQDRSARSRRQLRMPSYKIRVGMCQKDALQRQFVLSKLA